MTFKQGNSEMVFFLGKSNQLWNILQINRRAEDKDEGYQRAFSPSRVKSIAKYIKEGNPIPLSILVSFDSALCRRIKKPFRYPTMNKLVG